jgi:hypothetical protein
MEISFQPVNSKTRVTVIFKNIPPPAIRRENNEAGTALTLQKLERFVNAG